MYDRLRADLPEHVIFRDIDGLVIGKAFPEQLEEKLRSCEVVFVVIGREWLSAANELGGRRLDEPQDFVRLEVEKALGSGLPVVPVLVSNATMPNADQLPESLQALSFRHGLRVRPDPDFHRDMDRLLAQYRTLLATSQAGEAARLPEAEGARHATPAEADDGANAEAEADSVVGNTKLSRADHIDLLLFIGGIVLAIVFAWLGPDWLAFNCLLFSFLYMMSHVLAYIVAGRRLDWWQTLTAAVLGVGAVRLVMVFFRFV